MTLEILKTGINKAMAMVPMMTPMSVIISGSMSEVATRMEFSSFLPSKTVGRMARQKHASISLEQG